MCECVNKVTGEHAAVKIIDKTTIEPEEKGLLRTEIAGRGRIFSTQHPCSNQRRKLRI